MAAPLARKASLARFLEKRKERFAVVSFNLMAIFCIYIGIVSITAVDYAFRLCAICKLSRIMIFNFI